MYLSLAFCISLLRTLASICGQRTTKFLNYFKNFIKSNCEDLAYYLHWKFLGSLQTKKSEVINHTLDYKLVGISDTGRDNDFFFL